MRRRKKFDLHNAVLWCIAYIMIIVMLLAVGMADSSPLIAGAVAVGSLSWLAVFANVNKVRWAEDVH